MGARRLTVDGATVDFSIFDAKQLEQIGMEPIDVRHELAQADVFALACIIDSKGASDILPTVITEAMASRLPVVSTRLAGVPEMVVHGQTGLLVEPGDETALADALEKIARDPQQARAFGEAGRQRALWIFAEGPWSLIQGGRVHAHRSPDALTAWIVAQLSATEASAVIEDPATAPRKLLQEILPSFGFASLADIALRRSFGQHEDHMALTLPPSNHQLRLGPLKIKWRRRTAERDRHTLALELMRRLEEKEGEPE